jgi:hypothetical protein
MLKRHGSEDFATWAPNDERASHDDHLSAHPLQQHASGLRTGLSLLLSGASSSSLSAVSSNPESRASAAYSIMSQSYIIEVGDLAVGVLVRLASAGDFRFVASDPRVRALEGRAFSRPHQAERHASDILRGKTILPGKAHPTGAGAIVSKAERLAGRAS